MAETAGITEHRWEGLLDSIELGKVVPIVGRRLSLVEVEGGKPVTLGRAATERLARDLGVDPLSVTGLADLHHALADKDTFDLVVDAER